MANRYLPSPTSPPVPLLIRVLFKKYAVCAHARIHMCVFMRACMHVCIMCIHIGILAFVYMGACVKVWKLDDNLGRHSQECHPRPLTQSPSLAQSSPVRLAKPANEPQRLSCLCLPSMHHCT